MTLLSEIHELCKADSQFIIATHSPILMAYPDAEIYQLTSDGIQSIPYEECEHYLVTKQFLENPKRMLRYLLDDEN